MQAFRPATARPAGAVFALLVVIFAVVGAPFISRGVRGIVRSERRLDYAAAAAAIGAGHARIVARHLLPAAGGFIAAQLTMLVPGFIVAEATLSYVGLGFPPDVPSWGTMLQEASTIRAIGDFPWLLSPAAASFDMFEDYAARGRAFKAAVAGLAAARSGGRER